jgi:release factor glutamine methyltransferase
LSVAARGAAGRLTVGAALEDATARLARAGVCSPRADAEWLFAGITRGGRARLAMELAMPLAPGTAAAYAAAVERRAAREPLQQILGWEEFRGVRVRVTPDVLVPRPETETLVEWALHLLPAPGARRLRVADVGTGSGCIACALVSARADVTVIAVDVSPAAARVARDNIRDQRATAHVVAGDLLAPLRAGSVDALVANPPYLTDAEAAGLAPEVSEYEPRLAVAGGADGLDVLVRLVDDAPRVLRPGGVAVLETGGATHVTVLSARLRGRGFEDVAERADLAGVTRFVAARAPRGR